MTGFNFKIDRKIISHILIVISILILIGFMIPAFILKPENWGPYVWIPFVSVGFAFASIGIGFDKFRKNIPIL